MGNNPSHPNSSRNHQNSISTSTPTTPLNPFHSSNNSHLISTSPSSHSTPSTPQPPPGPPLPPLRTTFIDGGYLLPLSNIYPASPQDWLHYFTQRLILSRKLAPFYRGLEDWDPSWDQARIHQALTIANFARRKLVQEIERKEAKEKAEADKLVVSGTTSRRLGKTLEGQINAHQISPEANPFLRKEVFEAVLTWELRSDEALCYLKETAECPICFLYYPPNINLSRCCQQPICTECFVQIKRADPTAQELKSEPACCPYCVESNFGVTYEPPKQPGLPIPSDTEPTSTPVSTPDTHPDHLSSASPAPDGLSQKRRQHTSHTSVDVVTTDSIQPDWQAKLEAVRATVQRRANRRIVFRQEGDRLIPVGITSSRDPTGSAFLAGLEPEPGSSSSGRRGLSSLVASSSISNRRSRTETSYGVDLEELMIMEAMRLSLAEEEERKRKAAAEDAKLERERISQAISEACNQSPTSVPEPEPDHRSTTPTPAVSHRSCGSLPLASGSGSLANGSGSGSLVTGSSLITTNSESIPQTNSSTVSTSINSIRIGSDHLNISPITPASIPTTSTSLTTQPVNSNVNVISDFIPNSTSLLDQSIPPTIERTLSTCSSLGRGPMPEPAYEDLAEYEPLVGGGTQIEMELD
ncbi:hypothetical protein CROQUDRAFT_106518 [Cronartium quercuum f. sp. fusiforme G11]|uniref:RING-type domain-containing protein n=1 Tax=Cronartium quercuum f. sp. fusiforme G11 TaxID=708437 RepID=A0A9P6TD06_9BASI|nr:hypothetical protein CROQUDRAFT_106518 [Cronartium quercuum f. sp. fusiforme G11]